jgi:phosphoribosylglycinamide formyltransferase-1
MPQTVRKRTTPLRLAVLLSGGGRTLQNLAEHIAAGDLDAIVATVIGSKADAYGLQRARNLDVPAHAAARKDFDSADAMNAHIWRLIREAQADLVVLAGYLRVLPIEPDFTHRVVNIHPALLPGFGGHGMYGHHVHEAVLAAGCKVSGCTVHFCDEQYDTGPILVQQCVPVEEGDTPDTLAARVFDAECRAYPRAIQLIAQGRVRVDGRCVRIAQGA